MPLDLKFTTPPANGAISEQLEEIKTDLSNAVRSSTLSWNRLKYEFVNYVKKNGSSPLKRILIGTGVAIGVAIIIATIVLIARSYRRETASQSYENSVASDYSYYAKIDKEHESKSRRVGFYGRRNYEQRE